MARATPRIEPPAGAGRIKRWQDIMLVFRGLEEFQRDTFS